MTEKTAGELRASLCDDDARRLDVLFAALWRVQDALAMHGVRVAILVWTSDEIPLVVASNRAELAHVAGKWINGG